MNYRTILVYVDGSRHLAKRIEVAAQLAITYDAHLVGIACTGISRFYYQSGEMVMASAVPPINIDWIYAHAQQMLQAFGEAVERSGVRSYEKRLVNDEAAAALALHARYADLVVIGQIDRDESLPATPADLPEYVTVNCTRPVLVIPNAHSVKKIGHHILVAWDGSPEAIRAISASIPLLQLAKNVTVALFNVQPSDGVHGEEPGADIALYLARHDVTISVEQFHPIDKIGESIVSLAAARDIDLIVMGCFGHSRFREVMMGGVTLTMLKAMPAPLLLSH
jgi:nucleotide-binding universal stress UspA family protein